jgi:hypothetical protein
MFLHDIAQTEPIRPGTAERAGLGTVAPWDWRMAQGGWEDLSSARPRRAGDHCDSEGRPREPLGARRPGRRVPFARRRNSPQPESWHVLLEMQHTVRFVLGLKGTMSEAELHWLAQLEARAKQIDQQARRQIERAQYEADLACRRYRAVDPDNRLVARSLEREWNEKLLEVDRLERAYQVMPKPAALTLSVEQRDRSARLPRICRRSGTLQRPRLPSANNCCAG